HGRPVREAAHHRGARLLPRPRRRRRQPRGGLCASVARCPAGGMRAGCPPHPQFHPDKENLRTMADSLRQTIEAAFGRRTEITPSTVERSLRQAIDDVIGLLDSGQARVAEKQGEEWVVNEWLKKAVLLYFRANDNQAMDAGALRFYDKVPLKFSDQSPAQMRAGGVRV